MVRLRGHHLVCLHFFQGEGYGPEFVENLKGIMDRLEKGEEVEVIPGADDVCAWCPTLKNGVCANESGGEAAIRELDQKALAHLGLAVGSRARWGEVREKLLTTAPEWLGAFCAGCEWERVCAGRKKALGL